MKKTFNDFLQLRHGEQSDDATKEMLIEQYPEWLEGLDENDFIDYADEFAKDLLKALSYKDKEFLSVLDGLKMEESILEGGKDFDLKSGEPNVAGGVKAGSNRSIREINQKIEDIKKRL